MIIPGPYKAPETPKGENPKHAVGVTKVPLHLAPPILAIEVAAVFEQSAPEYGPYNWRLTNIIRSIYIDALERHLQALKDGQDIDPKSGRPHVAHIAANCAILLDAGAMGTLVDDRPPVGPASETLLRLTKKATA